jgi:hypothetical protein
VEGFRRLIAKSTYVLMNICRSGNNLGETLVTLLSVDTLPPP